MTPRNCYFILVLIVNTLSLISGKPKFSEQVAPNYTKEISCREAKMEMSSLKRYVKCHFRTILVKLQAEPGYSYIPDVIPLQRCQGYCTNDISCMAIETNLTSFIVQRQHITDDRPTCEKIYVEQHTRCKCLCDVMEQHCNAKQIYSEDDCACKCINMEDKRICEGMAGRRWNPETCKCMCDVGEEQCTTGLQWIPNICRCAKVTLDESNFIME